MKEDKIREEVLKEIVESEKIGGSIFQEATKESLKLRGINKDNYKLVLKIIVSMYERYDKAIDLTIKKCQKQKRKQVEWLKEKASCMLCECKAKESCFKNHLEEIKVEWGYVMEAFEDVIK